MGPNPAPLGTRRGGVSVRTSRGKNGKVRRSLGFGCVRSLRQERLKQGVLANTRERLRTSRALAMQKVVGSNPIIRSLLLLLLLLLLLSPSRSESSTLST